MPLSTILMLFAISGCQLLSDSNSNKVDFSDYYLWIKSLSDDEIVEEIFQQKSNKQSGYAQADVQLIMLYSLPDSPIHNPYTAKTLLNDYPLVPYSETTFSTTDLAFVVMLKDQLNQQLLLLEQLTNYKGAYQQSKKVNLEQQLKIDQLNKQIIQLKKIEKTLSNRGQ
ncbi:hypothetical protein [Candidatus Colwellia aromaticivorans]|uniref:hypothetical protein n=1 Tax=Candidatus Colwellia aromaticivorans TaxID=2267621 RepID=UPI000DF3F8B3|nr:hypothetical protein [Candidatus Colwellia aromaticivorans]